MIGQCDLSYKVIISSLRIKSQSTCNKDGLRLHCSITPCLVNQTTPSAACIAAHHLRVPVMRSYTFSAAEGVVWFTRLSLNFTSDDLSQFSVFCFRPVWAGRSQGRRLQGSSGTAKTVYRVNQELVWSQVRLMPTTTDSVRNWVSIVTVL